MKSVTAGRPVDTVVRRPGHGDKPPSERRLGAYAAVLLGPDHLAFGLGEYEFALNLSTLVYVDGVPQLGAQFFDVLFYGHRRHLLMFEKDDARGREERAGSRSAARDRTAAGGGAEMREHFGGTARP